MSLFFDACLLYNSITGGQRQRVSLARCAYSGASIYLFDDPLSAVDAHVGKEIFDRVIGPRGLLKDKTRLFATSSLNFLAEADQILMIADGKIVEKGTFNELKNKNGEFASFIRSYLTSQNTNDPTKMISNQLSASQEGIKDGQKKTGSSLADEEATKTGRVQLAVLKEYLMSCSPWIAAAFLAVTFVCYAFDMAAKFWLSDWTNGALSKPEQAIGSKFYQLGIYVMLSSVASKWFK